MKKLFLLTLAAASMAGCTAIPLDMGAERVEFVREAPKHCTFLGELTGSQGNWFTTGWTSDASLLAGARNELKNKANELGANVVVIDDKHHSARLMGGVYSSVVVGQAYLCLGRAPVIISR